MNFVKRCELLRDGALYKYSLFFLIFFIIVVVVVAVIKASDLQALNFKHTRIGCGRCCANSFHVRPTEVQTCKTVVCGNPLSRGLGRRVEIRVKT